MARRCGTQREVRIGRSRGARVWLSSGVWAEGAARWKRTLNMEVMSVTLEVSKLSGWLKARAACRVQMGRVR